MAERSVKVTLTLSASQYQAELEKAKKATESLGGASEKVGNQGVGALGKMAQSARDNREAWNSTGSALLAVGGSITAIGVAALKTGVQYNTLQQTTRAALTTMLGSAEAVEAQMSAFDTFARESPFARQVFLSAQQQLLGFGVEASRVIPILDAVQNSVAAVGGGNKEIEAVTYALAQMQGTGKLSGETLRDLGIYGINAAEVVAREMGMTEQQIRKMASKPGGIPVDQIWDPLVNGLMEKFDGAADGVKQTFEGSIDRVKAAWRDFGSELAEPLVSADGGGFLIDLANNAADTMRAFMDLPDPVKNTAAAIGLTTGAVSLLAGGLLVLVPRLVETWDGLAKMGRFGEVAQSGLRGVGRALPLVTGALAVGVTAFVLWDQGQKEAARRADEFAATLDETTGSLTENSRALAINNLTTDRSWLAGGGGSAADAAERLGIGLDLLTDAALGNSDALATLNGQLDAMGSGKGFGQAQSDIQAVKEALRTQNAAVGESSEKWKQQQKMLESTGEEQAKTTGTTEDLTEATEAAEKALQAWFKTAESAGASFGGITSSYQSVIEKNKEIAQSTADATKSTKDSWEDFYDGTTVTFDEWLAKLEEQRVATEQWATNYRAAIEQTKGLPAESQAAALAMIEEMTAAGVEGAPMLQQWVDYAPEQRQALIDAWNGKKIAEEIVATTPPHVGFVADLESADRANAAWGARLTAQANAQPPKVPVEADTAPAETGVSDWRTGVMNDFTNVPVDADVQAAEATVRDTTVWIEGQDPSLPVGADDSQARQNVGGTIGWVDTQYASLPVRAETSGFLDSIRNALYGMTFTARVQANVAANAGGGGPTRASWQHDGSILSSMPRLSPVAQFVAPGTPRVIGDRMRHDEAFIPLDGTARSLEILRQANSRMPNFKAMAAGGVLTSYPVQASYAGPTVNVSAPRPDLSGLARELARIIRIEDAKTGQAAYGAASSRADSAIRREAVPWR